MANQEPEECISFGRSSILATIIVHLLFGCSTDSTENADLTITNANVYPGPGESVLVATNISIADGKITAIYTGRPQNSALVIDADGRAVTAGLWNSHVHFTDPQVLVSSETVLRNMLLKYGFTTVIDTGSDLEATISLKRRIEKGELPGPKILTVSGSFVFTDGTPSYLPEIKLPEIARPEDAGARVVTTLDSGADGIKIFSGSFQGSEPTIHLPPDVIKAITDAAHSRGSFVFSHPTDRTGFTNAFENGVDVLAHLAPSSGPLGSDVISTMIANDVMVVPTLTLWRVELLRGGASIEDARAYQNVAVRQLAEILEAKGQIIFGTDVGYIDVFDTSEEIRLMAEAGMTFDQIFASMTTTPSARFSGKSARVSEGEVADIVIYHDNPSDDVSAFSRVAYTIRAGHVVYKDGSH